MQQRYYDPVIGRFYSNDPVGFTASNPMMFNRYAYANNNPYKYTDPDGKAAVLACIPAAAACGAAVQATVNAVGAIVIAAVGVLAESADGDSASSDSNTTDTLVDDLKGDKTPAPGVEGERGGLMGTPEQAYVDWEKIKGTKGAEVKDEYNIKLPDGSSANRHPSTRPYPDGLPAGTDTIKINRPGQRTPIYTGRYPKGNNK